MDYSKEAKKTIMGQQRELKIHKACILEISIQLTESRINHELKDIHINNLNKEIAFLSGAPPLDPVQ